MNDLRNCKTSLINWVVTEHLPIFWVQNWHILECLKIPARYICLRSFKYSITKWSCQFWQIQLFADVSRKRFYEHLGKQGEKLCWGFYLYTSADLMKNFYGDFMFGIFRMVIFLDLAGWVLHLQPDTAH